eukprot:1029513-Pelagomonas_calceolata.AAC.3
MEADAGGGLGGGCTALPPPPEPPRASAPCRPGGGLGGPLLAYELWLLLWWWWLEWALLWLFGCWNAEEASCWCDVAVEDSDARCGSWVLAEAEDAAGPASTGTVPYSLLQPGHWLRQCSLICCRQNKHTRYLRGWVTGGWVTKCVGRRVVV